MSTTYFYENLTTPPPPVWDCSGQRSPNSSALLRKISGAGASVIGTMCVPPILVFLMYVMFIDATLFFKRDGVFWRRRVYYAWILGTFPVLSTMYLVSLWVPLANGVTSFFGSFYYGVCFKKFFHHVLDYYGGKKKMVEALKAETVVSGNPFPCCCIVCCCRNQPMTMNRLHKLHAVANQVVYVYPAMYCLINILVVEGHNRSIAGLLILRLLDFFTIVASFVAMYSFVIVSKASRVTLAQYHMRGKYVSIQLVAAVNTAQGFLLGVLQLFNKLPCGFPYPDPQIGALMHAYIMIIELFILAVCAWFAFRNSEQGCEVVVLQSENAHLNKVTTMAELATNFQSDNISESDVKVSLEDIKKAESEKDSGCHVNGQCTEIV